jgi:hypothetical protein
MPTERIKPARRQAHAHSCLPALEKMQQVARDRMVRREEVCHRGETDGQREKVRAAVQYEGPGKLAHYHD